jgi:hypothetical protein
LIRELLDFRVYDGNRELWFDTTFWSSGKKIQEVMRDTTPDKRINVRFLNSIGMGPKSWLLNAPRSNLLICLSLNRPKNYNELSALAKEWNQAGLNIVPILITFLVAMRAKRQPVLFSPGFVLAYFFLGTGLGIKEKYQQKIENPFLLGTEMTLSGQDRRQLANWLMGKLPDTLKTCLAYPEIFIVKILPHGLDGVLLFVEILRKAYKGIPEMIKDNPEIVSEFDDLRHFHELGIAGAELDERLVWPIRGSTFRFERGRRIFLGLYYHFLGQCYEFEQHGISSEVLSFFRSENREFLGFVLDDGRSGSFTETLSDEVQAMIESAYSTSARAALVREAKDQAVYVPVGAFELHLPEDHILNEVLSCTGFDLVVSPGGMWCRLRGPEAELPIFWWGPAWDLTKSWVLPLVSGETAIKLIDLSLAALWRDLRCAGKKATRQALTVQRLKRGKRRGKRRRRQLAIYIPRPGPGELGAGVSLQIEGAHKWGTEEGETRKSPVGHIRIYHQHPEWRASRACREAAEEVGLPPLPKTGCTYVRPVWFRDGEKPGIEEAIVLKGFNTLRALTGELSTGKK